MKSIVFIENSSQHSARMKIIVQGYILYTLTKTLYIWIYTGGGIQLFNNDIARADPKTAKNLRYILWNSTAEGTTRNYKYSWNRFCNYLDSIRINGYLPTNPTHVIYYAAFRAAKVKQATISAEISAITHFNKINGYYIECAKYPPITDIMYRINKIYCSQSNDTRLPFLYWQIKAICQFYQINIHNMWTCNIVNLAYVTVMIIAYVRIK